MSTESLQTTSHAVSARGLSKSYGQDGTRVEALRSVDVAFERSRFTAIMGPSGSGKSTLMHCLAGLDTADGGEIIIGGKNLAQMNDDELTVMRREQIGFVFQSFPRSPARTWCRSFRAARSRKFRPFCR